MTTSKEVTASNVDGTSSTQSPAPQKSVDGLPVTATALSSSEIFNHVDNLIAKVQTDLESATREHLGSFDQRLTIIKEEIDSVQIHLSSIDQPWYRNVANIVAISALFLSLTTTIFAEMRVRQQEMLGYRTELRNLLQRLSALPKENAELQIVHAENQAVAGNLSSLITEEMVLIASRSLELMQRLPTNEVSAVEYYIIARTLSLNGDYIESAKLLERGLPLAKDFNSEIGIIRQLAYMKFLDGKADQGRELYRQALAIFSKYPNENKYRVNSTHFETKMGWSISEIGNGECGLGRGHFTEAQQFAQALNPPNPIYNEQLANLESLVTSCQVPAPSTLNAP